MSFFDDNILLEQRVLFGELLDIYASLLTEKQRLACELMLREDLSSAELGSELGMTRQGANDLVHRSRDLLREIERELGLLGLRKRCMELRELSRGCEPPLPDSVRAGIEGLLLDEVVNDV
ncbi:MAG: DNA-binding protein [Synergistaceae bacterium]|nr:DNA-binding protein [Synergistaceae bacterium]